MQRRKLFAMQSRFQASPQDPSHEAWTKLHTGGISLEKIRMCAFLQF